MPLLMRHLLSFLIVTAIAVPASAQEARRRWEMQRQIRLDKFEQVLPRVMRTHGIDMWIVAVKENHREPLWEEGGELPVVCGLRVDQREQLVTSTASAEPRVREPSPEPTIWPFLAAIATTILFIGSVFTPWAVVWGSIPLAVTLTAQGRLLEALAALPTADPPLCSEEADRRLSEAQQRLREAEQPRHPARALTDGKPLEPVYNLGSGTGLSVREIMDAMARVTGIDFTPEIGARRPGDPDRIVATGELAARDLDWRMRYSVDEMVRTGWEARRNAG